MFIVVIGTSIWVGVDAGRYRTRYRDSGVRGPSASLGTPRPNDTGTSPGAWVAACLLIWIVAFPLYLARRSRPPRGTRAPTWSAPTFVAAPPDPAAVQW